MGRDTTNQAMNNSGTAQGMASTYNNRASSNYNVLTPTLNQMATNPQGFSPQTMSNMNTAAMQTAGGGNGATVGGAMQAAARTNNAGAYDPAIAQAGHDASNQLSDAALGVQNQNAQLQEQQRQEGLQGLGAMYGQNASGAGNALGLSNGALNTAIDSGQHGWLQNMNTTMLDLSQEYANDAGGTMGIMGCPVKGSPYLMADGSEKSVELLKAGDTIMGIDDAPQTIEEIESGLSPVVKVTTDDGHVAKNSYTHAYALPRGGFTVASKSLGKTILTENGPAKVVSVEDDGEALVFNVMTDGSHTYRASGVWALGVGDAERRVSMDTWKRVGEGMAK